MRSLRDLTTAMVDIGIVLTIGIVFAAIMVIAFIIWTIFDQLLPSGVPTANTSYATDQYNSTYYSIANVTNGFDDVVNLMLIAITVFILAIAISALLMLRGRQ